MHSGRILMIAALAIGTAVPAFALTVEKSITVAVPPAQSWKIVSDLCAISDWHPSVATCELSQINGVILRTMALNPSGTIVDKFVLRDQRHQRISYVLVSSPLPVEHYESTMSVRASGKGSVITWVGHFSPQKGIPDEDASSWISDIYEDGLNALSKSLTSPKARTP